MKKYLSIPQAAAALSLSEATIWRRIADGTFTKVRLGERRFGIAEEELEAYIERLNPPVEAEQP
tara:strand:+ start:261 stop:452 length:192 start_codon:yes stop_codon:yes gene_type:complete